MTPSTPRPQTPSTLLVSFSTLVLEREWSAPLDGVVSVLGNTLNCLILLAVLYMLLLDSGASF